MTIEKRLKLILKFKGMTQKSLAMTLGYKPNVVSKMLNGRREIKVIDLFVIAQVFHCSNDDLIGKNKLLDELLMHYDED